MSGTTRGILADRERIVFEVVGGPSGRALKAWGDVLAGAVFEVGLSVPPDNVPERHAAIIGWSERKDEQLSLA